jgi:hypothetical protein
MASLLLPDEQTQPLQPLLPLDDPDKLPPALQPDPRAEALGQLYRQLAARAEKNTQHGIWDPNNPVGAETLQSMGMPKPTTYAGTIGEFLNPSTGRLTDRGQARMDDSPMLGFDTGGLGGVSRRMLRPGLGHNSGASGLLDVLGQDARMPQTSLLGDVEATRLPASKVTLNPDAVGFKDRVSTSIPSAKNAPDAHDTADYLVNYDRFNAAPDVYKQRVNDVLPRHIGVTDPTPEGFIHHLTGNIRALWDATPPQWREGAMGWYNGARTLAEKMADEFGTSVRQQAANLATLSPQRPWEHNVEAARRVAGVVSDHADTPWSIDHETAWLQPKQQPSGQLQEAFAVNNPGWLDRYERIKGKSFGEITDPEDAALWFRLHDRAYAPHNNARVINPDGTFGDFLRNAVPDNAPPGTLGQPSGISWGGLGEIGNAISVLRDGSLNNISQRLGAEHKVRNFYNNIVSPDAGHDVTIDTHAGSAALLRPLGSSNPEISYALGSPVNKAKWRSDPDPSKWWPTTPGTDVAGLSGLYPLHAEAIRRVAENLGVLPRQVQSVTWEGIRGLYNAADRSNKPLMRSNSDTWRSVTDGYSSPEAARDKLLSRGIRAPNWHDEGP